MSCYYMVIMAQFNEVDPGLTRLHPSRHIQINYILHQQTLEQVQSAKYPGLTITDDLDWGQHISEITHMQGN